jgi:hypothetical protein
MNERRLHRSRVGTALLCSLVSTRVKFSLRRMAYKEYKLQYLHSKEKEYGVCTVQSCYGTAEKLCPGSSICTCKVLYKRLCHHVCYRFSTTPLNPTLISFLSLQSPALLSSSYTVYTPISLCRLTLSLRTFVFFTSLLLFSLHLLLAFFLCSSPVLLLATCCVRLATVQCTHCFTARYL